MLTMPRLWAKCRANLTGAAVQGIPASVLYFVALPYLTSPKNDIIFTR